MTSQSFEDPIKKFDAEQLKRNHPRSPDSGEALPINNESQLFADDYLIHYSEATFRRLNRPRKQQDPILVPEKPWEGHGIVYGCILEEEDHYRLYYKAMSGGVGITDADYRRKHGYGKYLICMARSTDGLCFSRNAVDGAVVPDTNIVVDECIDDFTLVKDPSAMGQDDQYKILSSKGNWWAGLSSATSPDGIRWQWRQEHTVQFFGDRCSYWYDPIRKKHIAWSRNYQILGGRHIFHKETDDFYDWSIEATDQNVNGAKYRGDFPRLVMTPDRYDHEQSQFYGGYGFWYRSMYFAYLEVFYVHLQRLDTQLMCSRDGIKWTRLCDREIFMTNGYHDEFDAYWVVPTFNPPICKNGELLIHYNGRKDPHSTPGFTHITPGMEGAFGLSRLREDGFVSMDATGTEALLETKLLRLPGPSGVLEVNCCPFNNSPNRGAMGMKVEIVSANDDSICAYEIVESEDPGQIWYRINLDVKLSGDVKLRFYFTNCRLYSFRFK